MRKKKHTKLETKRLASTEKYIDDLQDRYSKLCAVRVDLSYRKPHSNDMTLDDANKHFNRMLNNRRNNSVFKDNVGYVAKKEYTQKKGVHFHTYFFFDGQKVKESHYKADQIGKIWKENITKSKGSYHNCHRNKYKYNGLGIIEHTDKEKRKALAKAIDYLCKDNHKQDIAPVKSNDKDRAFVRGTLPRKEKSKAGRPRKDSAKSED